VIFGIGTDIIEIGRVEKAAKNPRFMERLFSEQELFYYRKRNMNAESIAAGFSAKEAVLKALGTGLGSFRWKDVEILRNAEGKPIVKLNGSVAEYANSKGISEIQVTLSHSKEYATATAAATVEKCRIKTVNPGDTYFNMIKSMMPARSKDTHKGSYGKVFIAAGSRGMMGSGIMAAMAALRSGAGLVTLGVPESLQFIAEAQVMEVITKGLYDNGKGVLDSDCIPELMETAQKSSSLLVGPGLTSQDSIVNIMTEIINECKTPMVIDADGLNAIAKNRSLLKNHKAETIITPHPGEMAKLMNCTIPEVQADRTGAAKDFAREYNVVTVLKGHKTIIALPDGTVYINPNGNPGMATAGSGDVLAGIIAGFLGQGFNASDAAICGVYIHGAAGDAGAEEIGEYGLTAGDIIDKISHTIKNIVGK
jgi:NAD(P)H-hydrate epimerase